MVTYHKLPKNSTFVTKISSQFLRVGVEISNDQMSNGQYLEIQKLPTRCPVIRYFNLQNNFFIFLFDYLNTQFCFFFFNFTTNFL